MTIQRMPGSAITPGTITVTQLESSVANVINTGGGPKITAITVTNNAYTNLDDTAVSVAGGYIKITGTGFVTGCSIIIGSVVATSVSFISATEVRAQIPAQSAGTYTVYLVNPDGGVGIRVNGVNYSSMPSWTTTSPLPSGLVDSAISIQLAATSNSTVTYALQAGSTLPTGLTLSSAGLLSGTVTGITVDTTYNFTIVATDAELQDTPQAFAITITAVSLDAYYNLVSLHLKGDVATGGNLTVFSDASTNNFQLTTNGDVRGAAFSPYNTSWSVYFDGSGDYLNYTQPGGVGNGDFTLEFWLYPLIWGDAPRCVWDCRSVEGGTDGFWLGTDTINFYMYYASSKVISTSYPTVNAWTHISLVRSGNDHKLYFNGTQVGSTYTAANNYSNTSIFISRYFASATYYTNGYFSSLRLVKGTAVYTGNFTPPTSPLTAISGTSLLTCHANRFIDTSTNNFTITRNGDSRISSFSPFLETDTTTGSGYFDGTGDYLDVTNALFNPAGAFTIEFWFYPTDGATQYQGLLTSWPSGLSPAQGIIIWKSGTSGNDAEVGIGGPSTGYSQVGSFAWANCVNRWNHLVLVRNSSDSCAAFINGSRLAAPITKSGAPGQTTLSVGRSFPNITNYYFQGYISNLHYVSGSSIYDPALTTISIPTVPITKVTNTALLTLQNRVAYNTIGFQDESEYQHIITRYGNAAQGTFSPFSPAGWSNYFNGSSYLIDSSLTASVTGDFTLEFWWYPMDLSAGYNLLYGNNISGSGTNYFGLSGTTWVFNNGSEISLGSFSYPANNWYHIALVRSSGNLKVYVNGTGGSSYSSSATWAFGSGTTIGSFGSGFIAKTCYLSNVRLVNGQALFTGNFTPGTSALTATTVGHTGTGVVASLTGTVSVLTCQSNRFRDASTNNFTITTSGSPSVAPFSPFAPFAYDAAVHGGSGYFDGSGDKLTVAANTAFQFGTGDFCIEFWIYPVSLSGYQTPIDMGYNGAGSYVIQTGNGNGIPLFITGGSVLITSSTAWTANSFNHVAVCRSGTTLSMFVNGLRTATVSNSTNFNSNSTLGIGAAATASPDYPINGYMSNVRLVKGSSVYDPTQTSITVPSGPLPLINNTSLLLNFTNGGVIDSTGKNIIETVGNAGVVTAVKKYGTGSIYFDGSGDGLMASASQNIAPGSGNFTVEGWVYIPTLGNWFAVFSIGDTVNSSGICLQIGTNGRLVVVNANLYPIDVSSGAVSAATWTHLAMVRSGTTVTIYVNGVSIASGTLSSTFSGRFDVGSGVWNGTYYPNSVLGYIDDFRYTRGYARYTANFTAPTKAFADQGQASIAVSALAAPTSVDYLVVAGGGGGGSANGGAGGGGGGFRTGTGLAVTEGTSYTVTIGGGGAGGSPAPATGAQGSSSVFSTVTSAGGGYGGRDSAGGSGGSGGGGSAGTLASQPGGAGNTPSVSPSQGNNGGSGINVTFPAGGGGGGASSPGVNGTTGVGGNGGAGQSSSISGSTVTYAGGGGGGTDTRGGSTVGTGGTGGGGNGGAAANGSAGTANTGGGGGGGGYTPATFYNGAAGGSGIVIIAYPTTFKPLTATLGLTYTVDTQTRSGYRVYRFLGGTGSISW